MIRNGNAISSFFADRINEILVTYKLIPDYAINNDNNEIIANAISHLYSAPKERLNIKQGTYFAPRKVYFDILFKPKKAEFYMSTPYDYKELIKGSLKAIWNKSNITEVNPKELRTLEKTHTEVCELILRDYNFKSLSTHKGDLYPLTNMMTILKALKENEQVRINIAIEPIKRRNWVANSKDEFKSYQKGYVVNNEMSTKEKAARLGFSGAELLVATYIEFKLLIFESILGLVMPERKENQSIEIKLDSTEATKQDIALKGLTPATTYKLTAESFRCRITILSQSSDKNRAKLNMLSVANSYKDISGDNELVPIILTKNEQSKLFDNVHFFDVPTSKKCILSDREVGKLIQLPQKDLQNEYKIESIDTREIDIPEELQNGPVGIGIAELQGRKIKATWSKDKNIMALGKLFVGPQNAGKTTAIKRTTKECHKAGYSNIVIDFIESCETAREVAEVIPDKEKVIIELGTKNFIPALAYNEVTKLINENMDPWERVRLANLISEQVEYLIDSLTDDKTGDLSAPMLRYLHSACMVTFIKPGAKIADVFAVLRRWDRRNEAIRYAKYSKCFGEDDDIFFDLEELHQRDNTGKIVGTRENLIIGILNRITMLQKHPYLKAMLNTNIDTDQDFVKYIEQGKSVFIKIPQYLFPSAIVRDTLTTFYISRIWLAVQMRKDNANARLCNVIFDEVHQVPTTARFLSNHVTEFRRHRLGLILTCHFLKQLGDLLNALKSSGVSYVLIAGTEKENLEKLREELAPFTVEDGLTLKKHHSLNIINYGNQYAKFIANLPKS